MRWWKIGLGFLIVLFLGAGAFSFWLSKLEPLPVEPPHVADPDALRTVAQGQVVGFANDYDTQGWLGIPYAAAPVGALRWRAPRPALAWSGTKQALAYGSICPQFPLTIPGLAKPKEPVQGQEDCLFLNIFAPRATPSTVPQGESRLPVMVWFHGGGHAVGSSNTYGNFRALAGTRKVIVVTINYRLGILGWLHHPALYEAKASAEDRSGNYGTLDTIAALRWVKDNIAAFGGDPTRVTIFGESAGGANVFSLLTSPAAKGLFQRAISESGLVEARTFADGENFSDDASPGMPLSSKELLLALLQADHSVSDRASAKTKLAAMPAREIEAYLRGKSVNDLFAAVKLVVPVSNVGLYPFPHAFQDGAVLAAAPALAALSSAKTYNQVPVIMGNNHDEFRFMQSMDDEYVRKLFGFVPLIRDKEAYLRDATIYSEIWRRAGSEVPARKIAALGGSPVYVYRFDWAQQPTSPIDQRTLIGAGHTLEMAFVEGEPKVSTMEKMAYGMTEENAPGRKVVQDAMTSYWAEFAYSGNPGKGRDGTLPEWKTWPADPTTPDKLMVFDDPKAGGVRMSGDALSADGPADLCLMHEKTNHLKPGTLCRHQ
jgi:para-nitrobenzyl esterase